MCIKIVSLALFFGLLAAQARADPVEDAQTTLGTPVQNAGQATKGGSGLRDFSFVALPIPISDPAIGSGVGVAALGLYKVGSSQRPWTTGVGGLYTDSKSWAAIAFQKAYIDHDRFIVTIGAGKGDFNLDFYGVGQKAGSRGVSVPMEQDGTGVVAEVLAQIAPHTHLGVRYRGAKIDSDFKLSQAELPFPDLHLPDAQLHSQTSALGFSGDYDTRDSDFNPRKGIYAQAQWMYAADWLGSDFNYPRLTAALNGYYPLNDKTTIAMRGSICRSGDKAPFYDLCNFGSQNDLRGYSNGQFRDRAMFAVQAELRQKLFWRLGYVAFAGVGEVAPEFAKMNSRDLLPAAGVGLRIEASRKYRVNVSIDYAVGHSSDGFYFYVGEAF